MSGDPTDETVKKFELELETFGKRNKPKLTLIGDLKLCIRTCKTPQVRDSLSEMMRKTMDELQKDMITTDKKLQNQLALAAKKAASAKSAKSGKSSGKGNDEKQTKLKFKLSIDRFTKKYVPPGTDLHFLLAAKPKSEFPFVDYKKPIIGIGGKF